MNSFSNKPVKISIDLHVHMYEYVCGVWVIGEYAICDKAECLSDPIQW